MKTVPLTGEEHGICIGIGAGSLIWGVFVKFIPARWFEKF